MDLNVAAAGADEGRAETVAALEALDMRLRWLSAWTIHNANHLRDSRDGLKVGGHQASCASITAIMSALYFHALGPNDKVAVKPHAGPVLHAIHYLLGAQTRDQLERFRGFGGAQSYPSRTKDKIPIDFSTGSVGLGVAITAFASLVQDYLIAQGQMAEADAGRMIALMGDAELDEGNIYECLIEAYKHSIRNCWWIVDYNRQSLDATTADRMFDRFGDIFATCGWRVLTLKHGKLQRAAFRRPGGEALRAWIDHCPNADYAALTYQGGAAWRARLLRDIGDERGVADLIGDHDDEALAQLMTNLGGHCVETLIDAFASAADETPTLFIAYTVKGFGLPFAGHKDNHAGLMTPTQIDGLRSSLNISEGEEWAPYAGLGDNVAARLKAFVDASPIGRAHAAVSGRARLRARPAAHAHRRGAVHPGRVRAHPVRAGQVRPSAGGADRHHLARRDGLHQPRRLGEPARPVQAPRAGRRVPGQQDRLDPEMDWQHAAGQHIELGIAENNFFLLMTSLGLSAPAMFGTRLIPVGTVYDPFISRGLDALNYGCYQDARFLLVATPSGLTLGPEGGAHQSTNTPLIGMGQPGLTYFEPAFADELAVMMRWAFMHMQAQDGGSVYLRLSTRTLQQTSREDDAWEVDALKGGYWLKPPAPGARAAIAFAGAMAPEALQAWEMLGDDLPGLGLLAVTSPDLLHRGWTARRTARWTGGAAEKSHVEQLLEPLAAGAGLVTVIDGAPSSLSWLGAVRGLRVSPLGTDRFGQTGDLQDLYGSYRLDAEAIIDAAADLLLDS